jgi:hypothetical protein
MFQASTQTVELACQASPFVRQEMILRDELDRWPTNTCIPDDAPPDLLPDLLMGRVLANQFLGYLAMIRGRHAHRDPGSTVVVLDETGDLQHEAVALLAQYFHTSTHQKRFKEAVLSLTHDFRQWLSDHTDEGTVLGLQLDDRGRVLMTYKPLEPVLSPLTD